MPPTFIGRGRVGSSYVGSPTRVAWEFDGQKLSLNASSLQVTEQERGKIFEPLDDRRKILYTKASGDPRVAGRYHTIEMGFNAANHELVQLITEKMNFFGGPIYLKFMQFDFRNLSVGGTDKYDAARMAASTPGASTCALWFWPMRNLSNDSGDGPTLYKNGTAVTSGVTWNYLEGSVTFASPPSNSDVIRAYGVWKPRVRFVPDQTQMTPRPGLVRGRELYDIRLTALEL